MKQSLVSLFSCVTGALAVSLSFGEPEANLFASIQPRQASCENGPDSRQCWGDYSIDTNYYDTIPDGQDVEVWLSVEQGPCAPDGYNRTCMTFNGTIPGPTIYASWGDTLIIHVTNNMVNQGTAIHWHGLRQLNSFVQDGVPGVTQCPIGPRQGDATQGETLTYRFRVTQYGSTWYHSHQTLQYPEGLFGGLVLRGPATANYTDDLGVLFLQDWSHTSAFTLWNATTLSPKEGIPPLNGLESTLINGTNTFSCTGSTDPNCLGTGTKFETVFQTGNKYLLRLINPSIDAQFQFSIDGHNLTVIATDLVPIEPFVTDSILVSIGQRYDVIVEANASPGDYWIRGGWVGACAPNQHPTDATGILRYDATSTNDPTTSSTVSPATTCLDEPSESLVPHLKLDVTNIVTTDDANLTSSGIATPQFHWILGNSNLEIDWENPTVEYIISGNTSFPSDYNVVTVDKTATTGDQWAVLVIEDSIADNLASLAHPVHLHGHDFWVLAQTTAVYDPTVPFNLTNTLTRRDVAMLPGGGHLAFAFKLDNPGAWLVHCHIAWHASQGLGLEFLESPGSISISSGDQQQINQTCTDWVTKYMNTTWPRDDSGI
ncbi:laccase-1 [Thozetella sp. PMI_491]|nr:laccase-1 [Thozetella sp. PMI_491]